MTTPDPAHTIASQADAGTGPSPGCCAVIVLAKAPLAGLAKTRLAPALGTQGAADLAARLLRRTLRAALASGVGPVTLCAAPAARHPGFGEVLNWPGLHWSTQPEADLGIRMRQPLQQALSDHATALLIGTDAPALDADHLRAAAAALHTHDAVFGPTHDGGYVLVGLAAGRRVAPQRLDSEVAQSLLATLFDADMPWSTARVMPATRERLRACGARWAELPPMHDIDEPADLAHLPPAWAP